MAPWGQFRPENPPCPQIGVATVAFLAGYKRTVTGDDGLTFNIAGAMAILAALLILQLNPGGRAETPMEAIPARGTAS